MPRTWLFSPIGGTDPISNDNLCDGSMLHIARHYRPDVIRLFLSKEMLDHQREDDRYRYCLDRLFEMQGRENVTVEEIPREGLTDAHDFNLLHLEFRAVLKDLAGEISPGDRVLINISSGTPAMKDALLALVTLEFTDFMAIQVTTPNRGQNRHDDRNYDVKTLWECDPDNEPGAPCRACEATLPALLDLKTEGVLEENLRACDYPAAARTAGKLPEAKRNAVRDLIRMAQHRYMLDYVEVDKLVRATGYDCIPIRAGDDRRIFEYALGVQLRLKREEYADYVRSWTPLIFMLMVVYLKRKCGIIPEDFARRNRRNVYCFDKDRLDVRPDIRAALEGDAERSVNVGSMVGSGHLSRIIEAFAKDPGEAEPFMKLRKAEEDIRNRAAHDVCPITAEDILKETSLTAEKIMDLFRRCVRLAGISASEEAWNSYDRLNEEILLRLKQ